MAQDPPLLLSTVVLESLTEPTAHFGQTAWPPSSQESAVSGPLSWGLRVHTTVPVLRIRAGDLTSGPPSQIARASSTEPPLQPPTFSLYFSSLSDSPLT